jgi:hypothetical protein
VTATLPTQVQSVFERFLTTELTTIDERGQPITGPVAPRYRPGAPCIDISLQRAAQARGNPQVALLFCDATGSGLDDPPMVLVQGTAAGPAAPPVAELAIRPERVYVWTQGEADAEPVLYDAHMEEVRSGHSEEPERYHAPPQGGPSAWDGRLQGLGSTHPTAVLSVVSPDGFPFSVRVRVRLDAAARWVEVAHAPSGLPLAPGRACLTTESRDDPAEAIQVRGDLVRVASGWTLIPHAIQEAQASAPRHPIGERLARLRAHEPQAPRRS